MARKRITKKRLKTQAKKRSKKVKGRSFDGLRKLDFRVNPEGLSRS